MTRIILGLLLFFGLFGAFVWSLVQPVTLPSGVTVTVLQGQTVGEIGKALEDARVVREDLLFQVFFRMQHPTRTVKAGTYTFSGTLSLSDVSKILIAGTAKQEKTLRIIEGWTMAQIEEYLQKNGVGTGEEIRSALRKDWSTEYAFLPNGKSLEGYLFPDTYRVFHDVTPADVIGKMLSNFDSKFPPELRGEVRVQKKSLSDVVTLASIIEREVKTDMDKALVSDLFWRRIGVGMALGADSTVNYVTGKNTPQATYADIKIDSPYNTYKYKGLPPGPISNPGLSSLLAALRPEKNGHWYFLTAKHDGRVIYSKTFEEHVRNKGKYLGGK